MRRVRPSPGPGGDSLVSWPTAGAGPAAGGAHLHRERGSRLSAGTCRSAQAKSPLPSAPFTWASSAARMVALDGHSHGRIQPESPAEASRPVSPGAWAQALADIGPWPACARSHASVQPHSAFPADLLMQRDYRVSLINLQGPPSPPAPGWKALLVGA